MLIQMIYGNKSMSLQISTVWTLTPLLLLVVSDKKWTELDAEQHRAHAMRLLDSLEVIAREKRLKVARAILYMAQGLSTLRLSVFCVIINDLKDINVWP